MPVLKMYIGRLLVDFETMDYTEMKCATAREDYQQRVADEMYRRHIRKIKTAAANPVFYVDGEVSNFENADDSVLWNDLKMDLSIQNIKNEREIL